jgi:excisionase family DNA binding protein
MDRTIITRSTAATMLATSERHIRHLVDTGRLPAIHVGGKQRFVTQDVLDFIEASVRAAEARRAAA